jgi:hypothetical protein
LVEGLPPGFGGGTGSGHPLAERAEVAGIEALALSPRRGDFNEDMQASGPGALRAALRIQLASQDVARFMRHGTARTA